MTMNDITLHPNLTGWGLIYDIELFLTPLKIIANKTGTDYVHIHVLVTKTMLYLQISIQIYINIL